MIKLKDLITEAPKIKKVKNVSVQYVDADYQGETLHGFRYFKKGPWCDVMDGLYWKFIDRNKKFFLKNPRLSMMVKISEKMNKERKMRIFKAANTFIKKNTNG